MNYPSSPKCWIFEILHFTKTFVQLVERQTFDRFFDRLLSSSCDRSVKPHHDHLTPRSSGCRTSSTRKLHPRASGSCRALGRCPTHSEGTRSGFRAICIFPSSSPQNIFLPDSSFFKSLRSCFSSSLLSGGMMMKSEHFPTFAFFTSSPHLSPRTQRSASTIPNIRMNSE